MVVAQREILLDGMACFYKGLSFSDSGYKELHEYCLNLKNKREVNKDVIWGGRSPATQESTGVDDPFIC